MIELSLRQFYLTVNYHLVQFLSVTNLRRKYCLLAFFSVGAFNGYSLDAQGNAANSVDSGTIRPIFVLIQVLSMSLSSISLKRIRLIANEKKVETLISPS